MKSAIVFLVIVACLRDSRSEATLVYFDDADRAPSEILQIGGVTVTSADSGKPATVAGVGLGSAFLDPVGSIDRQASYPDGVAAAMEGVSLSVNGKINSFSIMPYFSVSGSSEDTFVPFEFSYVFHGANSDVDNRYHYFRLDSPDLVTITFSDRTYFPSSIDLYVTSDFGQTLIRDYVTANGYSGMTVEFGYSVVSLDYTPVPEPPTIFAGVLLLPPIFLSAIWGRRDRRTPV